MAPPESSKRDNRSSRSTITTDPTQSPAKRTRPSVSTTENPFRIQKKSTSTLALDSGATRRSVSMQVARSADESDDNTPTQAPGPVLPDPTPGPQPEDPSLRLDLYHRASTNLQSVMAEQHALQQSELASLRLKLEEESLAKDVLSLRLVEVDSQCVDLQKLVDKLEVELAEMEKEKQSLERNKEMILEQCGVAHGLLNGAVDALTVVENWVVELDKEGDVEEMSVLEVELDDIGDQGFDEKGFGEKGFDEEGGVQDGEDTPPVRAPPPRYSVVIGSHGTWADV